MTTVIDYKKIKDEIVMILRNGDVFTITERGVTTTTDTGSWSSISTHLINVNNIKNIRSITVDAIPLTFGTDYTYNIDYNDVGTKKCQITLNTAQTGSYVITYDYGIDKIYPDYPRTDLTISSYPRISVGIIGDTSSEESADGSIKEASVSLSISAYDENAENVEDYLKSVRTILLANQKLLYYSKYLYRLASGPLVQFGNYKIQTRNIDYLSVYNLETE